MQQTKKSVTARIPQELYDKCNQQYENMTDAIIDGLELLCNQNCNTNVITNGETIKDLQSQNETLIRKLEDLKKQPENKEVLQIQNTRIQDLQEQIKIKESQQETRIKDLQEQNKVKDQLQEARIADLKEQIQTLNEQIKKKDSQIEDSNKNVFAQANSLYNLTRENKLLPTEKKSFWQSLKFW
jgi:predicted  nucleic acid-binding Zn-ribbon protein